MKQLIIDAETEQQLVALLDGVLKSQGISAYALCQAIMSKIKPLPVKEEPKE